MEYRNMIHAPAQVHHTVLIGDGCEIWPFANLLEGVSLGKNCVIGSGVFLGRRVQIGEGTRIQINSKMRTFGHRKGSYQCVSTLRFEANLVDTIQELVKE